MEDIKNDDVQIMELKNIVSQIKTSLEKLIGILDNAKEKYQLT